MNNPYKIVQSILVTEKGAEQAETLKKFTFRVAKDATKPEIRRAVEAIFDVKVSAVNVMNRQGKRKRVRFGRYGRRPSWKKAVVTLSEGNIELI